MKHTSLFITLVLPFIFSTCTEKNDRKPQTNQLRIIVDVTDSATILPDSISVLRFFNVHKDKQNGAAIGITTITDKVLNPTIEISLPNYIESQKEQTRDDIHYRDKEIQGFYSGVLKALRIENTQGEVHTSLKYSECFKILCKQLQILAHSMKEGKKEVWVYGDMLENSNLYQAYRKLLATEQERKELIQTFEHTNLLPNNLEGISVRFFYIPPSRAADSLYGNMMLVYQTLLEKRRATLFVNASNNNND
jgi:hypothetical protein